jgi:hypothetical protein
LKEEIFEDCLKNWKNSDGHTAFWDVLAEKWDYSSGEKLRQGFKFEKKRRGIKKDGSFVSEIKEKEVIPSNHTAKILCFDIENTPILGFFWGLWDQNIQPEAIVQDWHLLSWSAKFLFDPEIISDVLTPIEAKNHDDSRICKSMWNLLNEADIVIGHNCNFFDIKKLNTRFLVNDILPPKPYQSIDTLLVAKNVFANTSNKLDYINQFLGLPVKKETDFDLWIRCYNGDAEALKYMEEYNRNDVEILEDLYLKLRPWIKNHPNLNLWSTEDVSVCPNCGSKELKWGGFYYTYTGYYKSFRCLSCGAIGRSRQLETSKQKRKVIVR